MRNLFGEEVINNVDVVEKPKNDVNVWTFINHISKTKQHILDDDSVKYYDPFIANKFFSQHIDTLSAAEFLNRNYHLSKKMQHDYLFYAVEKKSNRWKPWLKKNEQQKQELQLYEDVALRFNLSLAKVKSIWSIISESDKQDILDNYVYPDKNNSNIKIKKVKKLKK